MDTWVNRCMDEYEDVWMGTAKNTEKYQHKALQFSSSFRRAQGPKCPPAMRAGSRARDLSIFLGIWCGRVAHTTRLWEVASLLHRYKA